MAYRFDFIIGTIISLGYSFIAPIIQYLIFSTTNGYPGWSVDELILFQGILVFWGGFRSLVYGRIFMETMGLVRTGDFDRLLVKPYPPIGVLLTSGFNLNGIAPTLAGIAIIVAASMKLHVAFHWWTVPLLLAFLFFGFLLMTAFFMLLCTVLLMVVQFARIGELFERVVGFGDYPLSIFPRGMRLLFTFALPFAVWINFPAQVLLDRLETGMIWGALVSLVVLYASNKVWKLCLHNYTSAGG